METNKHGNGAEMLSELFKAGLMGRLMPLLSDTLRETIPEEPRQRRRGEMIRPLRVDEEYVSRCVLSADALINICEQMAYAVEFLSGFRARQIASGEPITRLDYIVYHLENHLIRTG